MSVVTHPSPETLAAFARGDLPPEELACVAAHIGSCGACCTQLARVPEDSLVRLARDAIAEDNAPINLGKTIATGRPGAAPKAKAASDIPAPLTDHPRYKVTRELGAGGMGVVYKAEHRIMGRPVALKVMAAHLTAKAGAVERFRKEVRAAAQLNHPNIVTAHDADEAGGLHFLVMEFVEGVSLDRLVAKKGPVSVQLAASFIRQAALGLQHAHDKNMVHRDIKPQNMMVTRKAQVKIMDFGLARFVHTDEEEDQTTRPGGRLPFGAARPVADPLTNPNLLMGTPDYLSPEQARNSHNVDGRSDIYSLGCTLFFLLTGKPPFASAPSLIDKLLAHTEEQPPPIRTLRPDVPEDLAIILSVMLAKRPEERFETAADVASVMQPFIRGEGESRPSELEGVVAPPSGVGMGGPSSGVSLRSQHPEVVEVVDVELVEVQADTAPIAKERTDLDEDRPRKKKSKKSTRQKARPWWEEQWVKLAAVGVLPLVVLAAIIVVGKSRNNTRPDDTADTRPSDGKGPKVVGKPAKPLPFLFVVPSRGINPDDYLPVRKRLTDGGIKVWTVSGEGRPSMPPPFMPNAPPVPVDGKITDVVPLEYAGVAFCGGEVGEYVAMVNGTLSTAAGKATHDILEKLNAANRPIGAICVGEGVLAIHGLLDGKSVARSPLLMKRFSKLPEVIPTITWVDRGVVTDGRVITARSASDAKEFAEALIEALRVE